MGPLEEGEAWDINDLRFPRWEQILEGLLGQDERVVTFYPHRMHDCREWLDVRVAVFMMMSPNHVVAVWSHGDNRHVRVYDNDSAERS